MSNGKPADKKPAPPQGPGSASDTAKRPVRVSYAGDLATRATFADGIHGISMRGGVARIDLYQALLPGDENQPEQRVVAHRLILPLTALGELAGMLNSMRQALQKATEQQREQAKGPA